MPKVVGFISQKGGQGKTTLSNALAYELKEQGRKVLLIDFDSQASQTVVQRLNPIAYVDPSNPSNITKMFRREAVEPIGVDDGVDLIPSNPELWSAAEAAPTAKDVMLKRFIESLGDKYDYVIVDTTNGAGTLMNNTILASDILVIPVATSYLDEAATGDLFGIIESTVEAYCAKSKRLVLVPNQFNKTTANDRESMNSINTVAPALLRGRPCFSDVVVTQAMPRKTVIASAFAYSSFLQPYIKTASRAVSNEIFLVLDDIIRKIINEEKE